MQFSLYPTFQSRCCSRSGNWGLEGGRSTDLTYLQQRYFSLHVRPVCAFFVPAWLEYSTSAGAIMRWCAVTKLTRMYTGQLNCQHRPLLDLLGGCARICRSFKKEGSNVNCNMARLFRRPLSLKLMTREFVSGFRENENKSQKKCWFLY